MMSRLGEEPDASVPPILDNLKKLEQDMRLAGDAAVDVPLPLLRNIKDDLHELDSLLRLRREEEDRRRHTDGGGDDYTAWADDAGAVNLVDAAAMEDSRLRQCLSCFVAFPAERRVKRSLLVHWWIGEGVVSSVQEAKECIDKLLAAGLVMPVRRPHCDKLHAFAVHRSVHSRLELEADTAATGATMATRLLVKDKRFHPQAQLGGGNGSVVTAYNIHGRYMCLEKEWMAQQTSMRVLQLGQWRSSSSAIQHQHQHVEVVGGIGFLERVGACRRSLRYLSLRGVSVVDSLPDQIGELGNLVVLDLHACHNLETLPESVGSLAMLEYLDVSNCYLLDHMPRTVANLSRLEVLKGFVASHGDDAETAGGQRQGTSGEPIRNAAALRWLRCSWRKAKAGKARSEPCRLSDLTRLRNLRKLSIFNHGASGHAHDDLGQLSACAALRSLKITWANANAGAGTRPPDATTSALPEGLKKLDLRRMPYATPPPWLSPERLKRLEKLCIRGGSLASLNGNGSVGTPVPPEPWPSVQTLRLRFLRELECEWEEVVDRRFFPELRVLEHWNCRKLSKWRREVRGGAEMRYMEVNHIQDFFYGEQNLCRWDIECDEQGIWREGATQFGTRTWDPKRSEGY